jgi:hypothetical protein
VRAGAGAWVRLGSAGECVDRRRLDVPQAWEKGDPCEAGVGGWVGHGRAGGWVGHGRVVGGWVGGWVGGSPAHVRCGAQAVIKIRPANQT